MDSLTVDQLALVEDAIRDMDDTGSIVKIDVAAGTVQYGGGIRSEENITSIPGAEEVVRAYIVTWLCRVGGYLPSDIMLEKKYSYGSGNRNLQLDIRLSKAGSSEPYALIEVKPPENFKGERSPAIESQLYAIGSREPGVQLLSLATVLVDADGKPGIAAISIDYTAHPHYQPWVESDRPFRTDIPIGYGKPTVHPYTKGGSPDLQAKISTQVLTQKRRLLHDRLWSGGNDDNQIYGWLVRFFITKIYDEQTTSQDDTYHVQVLHEGPSKEPTSKTIARLEERWQAAYRKHIASSQTGATAERLADGMFSEIDIAWVIETMQGISLNAAGQSSGDLLAMFFESITRDGFKQSKGLFFTHFNIAAFMVEALELPTLAEQYLTDATRHSNDRLPFVIDPSAGSGTFLLAAMRSVTRHLRERKDQLPKNDDVARTYRTWFSDDDPNRWASSFLYGIEKREDLAISTKVNMVLHQDGSTHVYNHDALAPLNDISRHHSNEPRFRTYEPNTDAYDRGMSESFDVIVTNPPFSISLDGAIQKTLKNTFTLAGKTNSENLFVERWYQLLKEGGRVAAVLPESTFSTAENAAVRRFIFQHFYVRALVALPPTTFMPWTPTRTSILFAQKKSSAEVKKWGDAYGAALNRYKQAERGATRAINAILKPRSPLGEEQLAEQVRLLSNNARTLGVHVDPDAVDAETALLKSREIKGASVEDLAFSDTVTELAPKAAFVGLAVQDVGYRRTKRAENAKPNELFHATDKDGKERVLNLNGAAAGWTMKTTAGAADALSVLKEAQLWQ